MKKLMVILAFILCVPAYAHLMYVNVNDGKHIVPKNGMVTKVYTDDGETVPSITCVCTDTSGKVAQLIQARIYYNCNYKDYSGSIASIFHTQTEWMGKEVKSTEIYIYPYPLSSKKIATVELVTDLGR